jgi:hypothetical protein
MTTEAELARLDKLHMEWEGTATSDTRRAEIVTEVQSMAEGQTLKCVYCKANIVHLPFSYALAPGHVYSEDGVQEVSITKMCEFCFDSVTAEPGEEF